MKINRQAVYEKCNGKCAYCGTDLAFKDMQVDHVIPQRLGYKFETHVEIHCEDNYLPSCRSCNNYKSGNPLESFRKELERQVDILRHNRPTFRLAERYGLIECKPKPIIFYFETLC